MQHAEPSIVIESSAANAGEAAQHIKVIVGDAPGVIFYLSLRQARSLAISLVEQAHRLEVTNSMRTTKLQPTRTTQIGGQRTMVPSSPRAV